MCAHRRIVVALATAGLVGVLAPVAWPSRCPVDLKVQGMAPSGTTDASGVELWFLTLSLSNRSGGVLTFARELMNAQAGIAGRWVEAQNFSNVEALRRHASKEVLVVVPFGTDACRLGIRYVPEPLHLRLMRLLADLGLWRYSWYQALARHLFPVGWLEPLRSDYTGRSPHWRLLSLEVVLPEKGSYPDSGFDRESVF